MKPSFRRAGNPAFRTSTIAALLLSATTLAGCATSKEKLLTHGDRTMMDIWQQEAGDGGGAAGRNAGGQLLDARQSLRRPLTDADMQAAPAEQMRYTRTARLGVLRLGNETLEPDPTVAHITDWYCPEAAVVMRQEVEQHGQTQVIDVVELKR